MGFDKAKFITFVDENLICPICLGVLALDALEVRTNILIENKLVKNIKLL